MARPFAAHPCLCLRSCGRLHGIHLGPGQGPLLQAICHRGLQVESRLPMALSGMVFHSAWDTCRSSGTPAEDSVPGTTGQSSCPGQGPSPASVLLGEPGNPIGSALTLDTKSVLQQPPRPHLGNHSTELPDSSPSQPPEFQTKLLEQVKHGETPLFSFGAQDRQKG